MIFPILSGFLSFRFAPVTWTLVFLNLFVLIYTSMAGEPAQAGLEAAMKESYFVTTQGRIYAQYLGEQELNEYPTFINKLSQQVNDGVPGRAEMLGQLAFRDLNFLKAAPSMDFDGDQVAFSIWQKKIAQVEALEDQHPSFTLGLNAGDPSFLKWFSYMFVHSGFLHFAGNMLFLIIFGVALERQIGGLGMLVVFLLSGLFAAGTFALMTGMTGSPLVGASGAISGIMALYCALNWFKPTRYFYWFFLPFRGFIGMVYLPAWVAIVLWAANDLAGYLGTIPELGGVAHTAHLGGEFAGMLIGLILIAFRHFFKPEHLLQTSDKIQTPVQKPAVPMGVLMPFLPVKPTPTSNDSITAASA